MLIIGSIPLMVLAIWLVGDVEQAMRSVFRQTYTAIAAQVGKEVHRSINGAYNTISLLSENPILIDPAVDNVEKHELLIKTIEMHPTLRDITLLNNRGYIITSAFYKFIGSWKSTQWFRDTLSGNSVFSKVHAVVSPFQLVMTVGIPIMGFDNAVTNILMAQIDMETISEIARNVDIGSRGNLMVVDEDGVIVAARDPDLLLEEFNPSLETGLNQVFTVQASLEYAEYTPWKVIITQPQNEAFAPLIRIRNTLIFSAIIAIALVAALSLALSNILTSRLNKLVASTKLLATGEFPRQSESYGTDEIGKLADAFYLAIDQIQSYSKSLITRNEELQQFSYVVSHDLREPLRMISSYIGLLERRYGPRLDKTAGEYIGFAVDGAERMERILTDLLTFSRLDNPQSEIEPVPIEDVIKAAELNLKLVIEKSGALVTYNKLPKVKADKSQLIQVFQNLIGNAIKFKNADRDIEIEIGAEEGKCSVTCWVKDNGIGIQENQQRRIFQIFQRLHAVEEYEGSGIGLAICKRIVQRHGGDIWVNSKPERGSTFFFTIPYKFPLNSRDNEQATETRR